MPPRPRLPTPLAVAGAAVADAGGVGLPDIDILDTMPWNVIQSALYIIMKSRRYGILVP